MLLDANGIHSPFPGKMHVTPKPVGTLWVQQQRQQQQPCSLPGTAPCAAEANKHSRVDEVVLLVGGAVGHLVPHVHKVLGLRAGEEGGGERGVVWMCVCVCGGGGGGQGRAGGLRGGSSGHGAQAIGQRGACSRSTRAEAQARAQARAGRRRKSSGALLNVAGSQEDMGKAGCWVLRPVPGFKPGDPQDKPSPRRCIRPPQEPRVRASREPCTGKSCAPPRPPWGNQRKHGRRTVVASEPFAPQPALPWTGGRGTRS